MDYKTKYLKYKKKYLTLNKQIGGSTYTYCFFYNDRRYWIEYDDAITFEKLQEQITTKTGLPVHLQKILKGAVELNESNFTSNNNDNNESTYEVSLLSS